MVTTFCILGDNNDMILFLTVINADSLGTWGLNSLGFQDSNRVQRKYFCLDRIKFYGYGC